MSGFWHRLRFLVTDRCNYSCLFCHNEGQGRGSGTDMRVELFERVAGALSAVADFDDVCISGGEPFCHPKISSLLRTAAKMFTHDLSCASNLSLMADEQEKSLEGQGVKFNVQFPFADRDRFEKSTGRVSYDRVLRRIDSLVGHGFAVGLNTVLRAFDESQLSDVLRFAAQRALSVKLLPDVNGGADVLKEFRRYAEERGASGVDKGTGASRWTFHVGNHPVEVLYVQHPCFQRAGDVCRAFGEIRIFPDGGLQTCLCGSPVGAVSEDMTDAEIRDEFERLWKSSSHC